MGKVSLAIKVNQTTSLKLTNGVETPLKNLPFRSFQIHQKLHAGHDSDFSDRFSDFHRAPTSVSISDI